MAISQSRPMGRDRKKGETFLNYVVDSKYGDSNGFQAGSTFKLFVLAAALDQGLPPSTGLQLPGDDEHPAATPSPTARACTPAPRCTTGTTPPRAAG